VRRRRQPLRNRRHGARDADVIRVRKLALTTHVASSVGWLGAVAAFLALAIAGLTGQNEQLGRAAYLAMHMTTWFVIVPLSFAALLTGLVQSLGTNWGLFRHYWVMAKLVLTVLATIILLVHTQPGLRGAVNKDALPSLCLAALAATSQVSPM
jgi:hypothetical protein